MRDPVTTVLLIGNPSIVASERIRLIAEGFDFRDCPYIFGAVLAEMHW